MFHDLSGVVGAHFGPKIFWSKFGQNRHFVGTIPPLLEGVRMNADMEKQQLDEISSMRTESMSYDL